jgi:hypothetical protein
MTQKGRYLALSPMRRLVNDMLHFARRVPTVPVERVIDVRHAQELREIVSHRISWCALFLKAYGLTAAQCPELRRAFIEFPRRQLYEHPYSIASLAVERYYAGELGVFFGHVRAPENQPLLELEGIVRDYKDRPIEEVPIYRRAIRVSRFPGPFRRLLWWYGLHLSGHGRARRLGTFGLSTYSGLGAQSLHPLSPLSTTLNYGSVDESGKVNVRVVYDHRVMDGAIVARALGLLEEIFNGELLVQMKRLCGSRYLKVRREAS